MAYVHYNPNPYGKSVGDCVVRALTLLLDDTWNNVFADLSMQAAYMGDMPNSDSVWGEYLKLNGYKRFTLPNNCPWCYTVKDFCIDYPYGKYVVGTGSHVIAVLNGDYYDTSDSGNEVPMYYWRKEKS